MIASTLEILLTLEQGNCATFLDGKVHVVTDGTTLYINDNRNDIGFSLSLSFTETIAYLRGAQAEKATFSKI